MAEIAREILPVNLEDEMRKSYLDYAMSVIVGRALPDVRDGLKPVHRRVLYRDARTGQRLEQAPTRNPRAWSATSSANTIRTAMRRCTTPSCAWRKTFSMRYLLVDGQGNFGSVDGDPPAAMRYTEVRMSRLAGELLADIDKETVDFNPNYDESEREPAVLPTRIPNLLINGSSGIAVGMATNIPPHNLTEIITACIALIENPEITLAQLMQIVPGPDFPTAGFINGAQEIVAAYKTGRGRLHVRARTHFEDVGKGDRQAIIITELPYQVNKARLIERIADLVRDKLIEGIASDGLRDESDKDGMRVVIELKRGEVPEILLNNLYAQTTMETVFGINMVALVDGQPRLLSLKEMLDAFLRHRREVVTRRTVYELRKARERGHILEGLAIALANIDEIIATIKASPSPAEAKIALMARSGHRAPCRRCWRAPAPSAPGRTARSLRLGIVDGRLPADRDPGAGHSGDAPQPAHRARAGQDHRRVSRSCWSRSAILSDILARPERLLEVIRNELRIHPRHVRRQAAHRDHRQSRRSHHRGSDLTRGCGGDAVAWRLCQGAAGVRLPGAAPRRPRQGGDHASRTRISSTSCSSPTRTTRCCASPITARSIGSRCTNCRRPAAVRAASPSSICCPCRRASASAPCCRSRNSRKASSCSWRPAWERSRRRSLALFSRPRASGIIAVALEDGRQAGRRRDHRRHQGHPAVHHRRQGDSLRRRRSAPHGPRGGRRARRAS